MLRHQRIAMVELPPRREDNLALIPALALAEHRILRELFGDADAARAEDAALGVKDDGRAKAHALWLMHRLGPLPLQLVKMLLIIILQLALACLIADRAIDRMVKKKKLLNRALRARDLFII